MDAPLQREALHAGRTISEDCRAEMVTFGIERAININKDVPLGESSLVHEMACNKPTGRLHILLRSMTLQWRRMSYKPTMG